MPKTGCERVPASLSGLVQVSCDLVGGDESNRDSLQGLWVPLQFG